MLELFEKRFENNKSLIFPLLIYLALLVWCIYLLVNQCLEDPLTLRNAVYLLFIIGCKEQLIISWRKFDRAEIKESNDKAIARNISFGEWRQAILNNDLLLVPSNIIAVFILFMAIAIILSTVVFKDYIFTVSYIKEPNYDRWNDFSGISLAIAFIVKDIPELFNIEQKVFKQISTLFFNLAIITGVALSIWSANYVTEVAP